ncbi:uncharacterized protein LOC142345369 [Convolutriloba macropyga]|uniref:uncharacterized protein LOC142345369 n=1 Tax=Convolutriloba macropyga TaxID=536237 RepID=UPI003F524B62
MSCFMYVRIISTLLTGRSKKIGRNLSLSVAFSLGCVIWIWTSLVKVTFRAFLHFYVLHIPTTEYQSSIMVTYPFFVTLLNVFPSFIAICNPFLLIIVLKSFREPFLKAVRGILRVIMRR